MTGETTIPFFTAAVNQVADELERAIRLHAPLRSVHEGYAVILEELDELKAEIWKRSSERDPQRLASEATQVAAMAVRFLIDLCPETLV